MKESPDLHITASDQKITEENNEEDSRSTDNRIRFRISSTFQLQWKKIVEWSTSKCVCVEITCFDVAANEIESFRWQKGSENSVHQNTLFLPFLAGQLIFLFISLILLAECRISLQFEKAGTGFLFFLFFYFFYLKYYFIRSRLKKKKKRTFRRRTPKRGKTYIVTILRFLRKKLIFWKTGFDMERWREAWNFKWINRDRI